MKHLWKTVWALELLVGPDGRSCVAKVKTAKGVVLGSIQRLVTLEMYGAESMPVDVVQQDAPVRWSLVDEPAVTNVAPETRRTRTRKVRAPRRMDLWKP